MRDHQNAHIGFVLFVLFLCLPSNIQKRTMWFNTRSKTELISWDAVLLLWSCQATSRDLWMWQLLTEKIIWAHSNILVVLLLDKKRMHIYNIISRGQILLIEQNCHDYHVLFNLLQLYNKDPLLEVRLYQCCLFVKKSISACAILCNYLIIGWTATLITHA